MKKARANQWLTLLLVAALLCGPWASAGAENIRVFTQSFEGTEAEYLGNRYYEKDTIQIKVDEKGKIIGCEVKQEKNDLAPIVYIETKGIFVYYQCDDYVLVQSDWRLRSGVDLSSVPIIGAMVKELTYTWQSYTWYYKMTNDGTLRASTKKIEPDPVSTLKIKDVLYPSEFKIDRVNGFYVTSGVVESNYLITYVSINLTDAQGVPVKGHPVNYTPNSLSFSIAAKDADIKFTSIQTPGDYVFTIYARDASGAARTLSMPVHATKDGSTIKNTGNSTDGKSQRLPGDVNGDGSVDDFDVIRLLKYVSGWDVTIVAENADVNGDGGVDDFDVIRLLKYVSGWGVSLN